MIFNQVRRFFYIQYILIKNDVLCITSPRLNLIAKYVLLKKDNQSRGNNIRCALETLGPIFIKFGQMLSTRTDLIPEDIAEALASLQDKVPPFAQATKILKRYYGDTPLPFVTFDEEPVASASIAQVHHALLANGEEVAVKILRPRINKQIKKDIKLMYFFAKLIEMVSTTAKQLNITQVIQEFEIILTHELDFMREAANASLLKRYCQAELAIPRIYWQFTTKNILVMEYVNGIPIHNKTQLINEGVNLKKLAENIIHSFFTQVFEHRFFHADLHPGNLFVNPQNPQEPQCIAVDFGIVGSLNTLDQRYLAENMLAFFQRDYQRVAVLHIESGWVPADTRIESFEGAIRTVCEPIFEKPLNEISVGQTLMRLFQTAREFKMEILPQFILLQKTMLNVESLSRQLYPEVNLWLIAKPILKRWLKEQVSVKSTLIKLRTKLPYFLEKLPDIPELFYQQLLHQAYPSPVEKPSFSSKKKFLLIIIVLSVVVGLIKYY